MYSLCFVILTVDLPLKQWGGEGERGLEEKREKKGWRRRLKGEKRGRMPTLCPGLPPIAQELYAGTKSWRLCPGLISCLGC